MLNILGLENDITLTSNIKIYLINTKKQNEKNLPSQMKLENTYGKKINVAS